MTINAKLFNYCQSQQSSTGIDPKQGEVLAPMMLEQIEIAKDFGFCLETLRTHSRAGVKYLVAFIPVDRNDYEKTEKIFTKSVNDFLKPYRRSRSKAPVEFVPFDDWWVSEDTKGTTIDLDNYFISDVLDELLTTVSKTNPRIAKTFYALIDNDGEQSIENAFKKHGIPRTTGFNQLPKVRALVSELLEELM